MPAAPDAERDAREYIDHVVELHRRCGYSVKLTKKRREQAVARVAETFRELLAASGRAP
jgi:hypothetical protein